MKIWIKVAFCLALGAALGFAIPLSNQGAVEALSFLALLILRIGRALALPLMFFSVILAIYQLHEDRQILRGSILPFGISLGVNASFVLLGILSVLAVNPKRISIRLDPDMTGTGFDLKEFFLRLFPEDVLSVLSSSDFLLPAFLLALILGLVLAAEKAAAKPAATLFDSLSRAIYHVNSFFTEFAPLGLVVLCADGILHMRAVPARGIYSGLMLVLAIDAAAVVLILLPALLWSAAGRRNPFRWMYGLLAPALTAFFSGDVNFSYGMLVRHLKESLGMRRRANALSSSIALIGGRAGSALVGTVSFLLVYRSFSSLGFSFGFILMVFLASTMVSLALSSAPGSGAFTSMTILCALLGHGYEQGYLLLKPVFWPLVASGAFLDVLVAGAVSLIVSRRMGMQEDKETRFFI